MKENKDEMLIKEIISSLMEKGDVKKALGIAKICQEEGDIDMGWYFDELQDYLEE